MAEGNNSMLEDKSIMLGSSELQNRGFRRLLSIGSRTYDLKGQLKKLMFEEEIMNPVTLDVGVFTLVMSTFVQFEKTVKSSKPDPNQVKELIHLFSKNLDTVFADEFPFFIILAHRLKVFHQLYQCDELDHFIAKCIDGFENLPPQQTAKTLLDFINQKDFDIMFGSEEVNTSVFHLLAIACTNLMKSSIRCNLQQQADSFLDNFIYSRILWISVHLKCVSEKDMITGSTADIWQQPILGHMELQSIELKGEIINDFKLGLLLASLLQLPQEVQFTAHHINYFLGREKLFVRPLRQAKEFILALESNIKSDCELLMLVLVHLRALYQSFLTSSAPQKICSASEEGTILGVLDEGISFMDGMTELWQHRGWDKGEYHYEFHNEYIKWLQLLLSVVKENAPLDSISLTKILNKRCNNLVSDQEFREVAVQILGDSIINPLSFTMDNLQELLEEKPKICKKEVQFDEVISMMEKVIVKQQEQNSVAQRENEWLTSSFEKISSGYRELWEQFEENAKLLADKGEKMAKLQEEYDQLKETHQQQLLKCSCLQEKQKELQDKITLMENSWKVSRTEVTLTKDELGRGGWGVVWIGVFREQRVACKQMYQIIKSKENLELLHREINTMAQLRHPNLLQFIGAILDDPSGNPIIITEIMDTSLRNAYETKQLTPDPTYEPVILTIMRDVAVGLNYLHCLPDPIIHRDVSSANVLLESKGPQKWKTKISDFGSANKACQAITRGAGAPVYSAPESLTSIVGVQKALTTKMDVFSYGVLLCEAITCRFPDPSVFREEMLQQIRSRSPHLHDLTLSCINEGPSNRPTMKEVIKHLDINMKQLPQ